MFCNRLEHGPPPWTRDSVLRTHKFTNAYRASDRVSQYLIRRVIYRDDLPATVEEVFFRTILFKLFNKIETWELLEREVDVQFADADCIVRTPEGMVYVHPGDAILTGNGGQHWRVSHAKFANKYRPLPPTVAGESGRYMSLPNIILALQMQEPFDVSLADGVSRLSGRSGDWLVDYGDGSLGIVAEGIFATTYEVLS